MKKTLFLLSFIIFSILLQAQNLQQISGVVKDGTTNELLIGVSILVTGTNTGTVTDVNGNFSLAVMPNAVLKVSYI